jgi:hypothetical protein
MPIEQGSQELLKMESLQSHDPPSVIHVDMVCVFLIGPFIELMIIVRRFQGTFFFSFIFFLFCFLVLIMFFQEWDSGFVAHI